MDVTLELESAHDARCNPVWRNAFFVFLPQRVFCAPFTALWRRQAKRRARMIGASATAKVTSRPFATLCAVAWVISGWPRQILRPGPRCRLLARVPGRYTAHQRDGLYRVALPLTRASFTVAMRWHPRPDADLAHRGLRGCLRELCGQ